MLVIDTEVLPRRDQTEAMTAALVDATGATTLSHHGAASPYLRMEQWQLGTATLVRAACSGHTQVRVRRRPARDEEPLIVIGLQHRDTGTQVQDGAGTPLVAGGVYAMVLTGSFQHVSIGDTRTSNLLIRAEDLDMPLAMVAQARPRLPASPLSSLVRSHVRSLARVADGLGGSPSMEAVGGATVQLARALVASASGSPGHVQDALAQTLVARVRAYILDHLSERNLTPATIAAAHHVSTRQLYKSCAAEDLRPEPWVIARRLEAAREELGRPGSHQRTIAAVAARWGFANSSHFSHRFREAYGLTPREWRDRCREGDDGAAPGRSPIAPRPTATSPTAPSSEATARGSTPRGACATPSGSRGCRPGTATPTSASPRSPPPTSAQTWTPSTSPPS
ncbi:helix-turn-helix domain-containing protein [Nocardioides sp. cx-169]|uniref:helix-turn-helix domain-containing protein n=1 Tax=Nocardioides sp. cx-169 TaxID=2899080 RepID=UPI001E4F22D4|nr:helix-turn-helix domain-containing protein [Nocardioides sp. cx-169]MCD4534601.1 helix-turn-helix domain-containing protein [Nocardioides sp. cx-169]